MLRLRKGGVRGVEGDGKDERRRRWKDDSERELGGLVIFFLI